MNGRRETKCHFGDRATKIGMSFALTRFFSLEVRICLFLFAPIVVKCVAALYFFLQMHLFYEALDEPCKYLEHCFANFIITSCLVFVIKCKKKL